MVDTAKQETAKVRQQLAVLRALARPGARQVWTLTGATKEDRLQIGTGRLPTGTAKTIEASRALIGELASSGLVAENGAAISITSAGSAWLRRQLAGEDAFQEQHRESKQRPLAIGGNATKLASSPGVRVNDAESPLAWLRQRKDRSGAPMLDDAQYEAGERLRRDYTFAAMLPRVTASWSDPMSSGGRSAGSAANLRDDIIAAKDRIHAAMTMVGPELGRILIDVCCLLKGIEMAESELGLPQRSGKVVLQLALSALARHYGLINPRAVDKGRSGSVLHWGGAGFRPTL